jgi:shikimate 5-dehydrogenase
LIDGIDGRTRLYGLFAHPATHSLSPLMHNLSFQHRQLNAIYLAFDLTAELSDAINSIRLLRMGGVNLSMPFKETVLPCLNELTPAAQIVGAVNTIINQNGHLIGANTDGTGFFANLQAHHYDIQNKTATILGAGGAGMSIIAAGASGGLKEIHVFKRRNASFPRIAEKLRQFADVYPASIRLYAYDDQMHFQKAVHTSDFLINTTNVGMGDDPSSMPLTEQQLHQVPPTVVVCDVIYKPLQTRLLQAAQEHGCATVNGLGMLIYQGAQAFQLWTHQKMPIGIVEAALKNKLSD